MKGRLLSTLLALLLATPLGLVPAMASGADHDESCHAVDDMGNETTVPCEDVCYETDEAGNDVEVSCHETETCYETDEAGNEHEVACYETQTCYETDEAGNEHEVACYETQTCFETDEAGNEHEAACSDTCFEIDEAGNEVEVSCFETCTEIDADGNEHEVACYEVCAELDEQGNEVEVACAPMCVETDENGNEVEAPCAGDLSLTFTVVTADGMPAPGATLQLVGPYGELLQAWADETGAGELGGLVAGEYLYVAVPGEGTAAVATIGTVEVSGEAGDVLEMTFELDEGSSVTGRVVSDTGAPRGGLEVVIAERYERCGADFGGFEDFSFGDFDDSGDFGGDPHEMGHHEDPGDFEHPGDHSDFEGDMEWSDDVFAQFDDVDPAELGVMLLASVFGQCEGGYYSAQTGADGAFAFAGLLPVPYSMWIVDAAGEEYYYEFEVGLEEDLDLGDITPAHPGGVAGSVSGEGLDTSSAYVIVLLDDGEVLWAPLDEDGSFFVEGVPPGVYELIVESNLGPRSIEIEVLAGQTATYDDIELDGGVSVTGVLLDADGKPVPHAYVALFNEEGYGSDAETDDDGTFEITGLVAGAYGFFAQSEDAWTQVFPESDDAIVIGEDDEGAEIELRFPSLSTLSGVVKDAAGKPVAGAFVSAWSDVTGDWAETGSDGRYTLKLPAGDYYLHAEDGEGRVAFTLDPVTVGSTAATHDLTIGAEGEKVSGKVQTASGKAAANVLVLLLRMDEEGNVVWGDSTITDSAGGFRFESVVDGDYTLVALVDDETFVEETVEVADGLTGALLRLPQAVSA